jgi:pyruvate dehydrogenase E2 component (dihydrolipoamide acetyltransferase)
VTNSQGAADPSLLAIPLTGLRGIVANRMHASLRDMAQYTVMAEADITAIEAMRASGMGARKLGYNDYIVKAVASALRDHPRLNAYLMDGVIQLQPNVHVGLAVALDEGVVVGVIQDAAAKTIEALAADAERVTTAVRAGDRSPALVIGSTFTVSSLGGYGVTFFTPVINPPEVGILGVGHASQVPRPSEQGIVWRSMLPLSLTIDHRAVDGVPAAAFLATVVGYLESPARLMAGG